MALCLNPKCQKRVPANTQRCISCGSQEISEFDSYSKAEALNDELSIENFHKVIKSSQPYIERTIVPKGAKSSMRSRVAVRFQFLLRKLFKR